MTVLAPPREARSHRLHLAWLLFASLGLRVFLAARGGQAYWPDEARFGVSREAAYELIHHDWKTALETLLGGADHVFFRWVGLPAALLELAIGGHHPALAACYFGLFSVGSIYLVWAVALRSGASGSEAFWAAGFAASSNSLFFYSRHYLPYDVALFGMLLALWLALGPWSPRRSLLVGVAAGFGFLTYNGYWLLGACVLTLHAVLGAGGAGRFAARSAAALAGLLLPIGLFLLLGAAVSRNVVDSYRAFAGTVKQGDFHVGFRLIPEYLVSSEGLLLGVLVLAMAYALATSREEGERARLAWWTASIAFLYCGLVFFSDVIPVFMVYGRLSRCIMPFLCLGAGTGAARFLAARGSSRRAWSLAGFVAVAGIAALNFSTPLSQVFPEQFFDLVTRSASQGPQGTYSFVRVLNTESFWGRPLAATPAGPREVELLRRSNPIQFKPYQYEGFTAAQRRLLSSGDMAMRVLGTPMTGGQLGNWDGFPGPVRMTVTFPKGRAPYAEPLMSSGRAGSGDVVYVRYLDAHHVRFGLDHWGAPAIESRPVEVDFDRPHTLIISAGLLLPSSGGPTYGGNPTWGLMRGHFLVEMDGLVALSSHADFYSAPRQSIRFGVNAIGGSSTTPYFTGEPRDFEGLRFEDVAAAIPVTAGESLATARSQGWRGALGPVRMRFILPERKPGPNEGQPLVSIIGPGVSQVLFVVRDGNRVRVGFDNVGTGGKWSEPMDLSSTGTEEMDISVGPLLPPAAAPVYGSAPNFAEMRRMVFATFNGRLALFAPLPRIADGTACAVFAANVPGSTACAPFFKGEIVSVRALELSDIPPGQTAGSVFRAGLSRPGWGGYSGPLSLDIVFGAGAPGDSQPILTTGLTGKGDIVFVRYESAGMARICVDHWGAPLASSSPFTVVPGAAHVLKVSLGSLFPPGQLPAPEPGALAIRTRVLVDLDGRRILDLGQEAYPSLPEWVTFGANYIGGSVAGSAFFGEIRKVTAAPPGDFAL